MKNHSATTWLRLVIASLLAAAMGVAISASGSQAALDYDSNGATAGGAIGDLSRFQIDGDPVVQAAPGSGSNGSFGANVNGDWNATPYGPQPIGSNPAAIPPAGIGSSGLLPLVFTDIRAEDVPFISQVANPQFGYVDGAPANCPVNIDDSWVGGTKVDSVVNIDEPVLGPDDEIQLQCANATPGKGDLFNAYAAYEIVAVPKQFGNPAAGSQNRTIIYGAWERGELPGELNFYVPISDGVAGNSAGDRLIAFDYDSAGKTPGERVLFRVLSWNGTSWVVASAGNGGTNPSVFEASVGYVGGGAFPANGQPSFGEFALDLTATGILPDSSSGQCVELSTAGYIFTETGNSGNAQLTDYVGAPKVPISNCGDLEVTKAGPANAGGSTSFPFRVEQQDSEEIRPNGTTKIDDTFVIGETKLYTNVYAQPDYVAFEDPYFISSPGPVALPTGWQMQSVTCTYVDLFNTDGDSDWYEVVTETLWSKDATPQRDLSKFLQVIPAAVLDQLIAAGEVPADFVPGCVIDNLAAGIVVEKQTLPDGSTTPFPFTVTGTGVDASADLADGQSEFFAIPEGTVVTITEGAPNPPVSPGFVLDDITCLDALGNEVGSPSGGAGVTVAVDDPANVITCTFTNVQNGRIIIDKTGLPADSDQTFDFTIAGPAGSTNPVLLAVDDLTIPGPASTPSVVAPGTYTVTELEPPTDADWVLVDIVCDNEQSQDLTAQTATVTVAPGETVNCTFSNNQRGPVTVVKDAVLVDPAPVTGTIDEFDVRYTVTATSASNVTENITVTDAFDFPSSLTVVSGPTLSGPGQPSSWDGDAVTQLYVGPIAAGAQLVWTIDVRVRLDLDAPSDERDCNSGGSGAWNDVTLAVAGGGVSIDDACVPFGDPQISVDKTVVGDVTVNADQTMSVTYEIDVANTGNGPGSYDLSDSFGFPAWVTVTDVSVANTVPGTVGVEDGTFDGDVNTAITSATTGIGAGQTHTFTVAVTFTAAPTATDDGVVCQTGPGDGLFNLAAITSTSGPDDDPACIDIPRGRIVVTKATFGGTGTFSFSGVALFPGNAITTTTDDGTPSAPISAWVTPGTGYGLTETAPAGWTKITEPCTGPFSVADGQTVNCDYENGKQGEIIVVKNADPDGTFPFALGGAATDSADVSTSGGTGSTTFSGLDAGTYTVTETTPNGYFLDAAVCGPTGGAASAYTNGADLSLEWGASITCTYNNEAYGEITIAKTTLPATDPAELLFDFEVSTGATIQVGNGQLVGTGPLVAGEYTVSEIVPAGWDLTDLSCAVSSSLADPDNGSSATYLGPEATITLEPGDTVRCDFENTQRGEIVVTKDIADGTAVGAALLQTFDFDLSGDFATDEQFTLDGNGDDTDGTASSETFEVRPGAYTVQETVPDDWNLDSAVCTGGQDPSVLTVAPGQTVECTFTNSPDPADVTIRKSVVNVASDYAWSFDFTIAPDPDGDGGQDATKPAAGTGPTSVSIGWTGLIPGQQYTISETVPANWTQTGLVCIGLTDLDEDATNASVTFVAEPGQSLSCSVTNTPDDPTITIIKTTVGGIGSFDFEVTPENDEDTLIEETIVTETDGVAKSGMTYTLLTGLTYAVDELDPGSAWAEGALDCGDFGTAAPGLAVDVTGQPGDDIVCEISNSALGNITVIKSTVGADGTFGFELDDVPFSITTDGGSGQEDFQNLQPGEYVITETDPTADFDGTALSCVSSNGDQETVDLDNLTATVDLSNGETVVCTFTNTERAHILVDKVTNPTGDDTMFTFTEDWTPLGGSFQIADGDAPHDSGPIPSNATYTLVEAPTPGWVVTDFECTGGENDVVYDVDANDADGASAEITPTPGETILCTVTNNLRGPVTITKVADPAGVTRSGGVYTVSYDLTVGTESYITEDFTLTDTPAFAAGTTIQSTTVTDELANEVTLPLNGSIDPGETLVYTVTIELTIDGAVTLADRECAGTGTATFNSATVTFDVDPGTDSDDDCVDLPLPDIGVTKTAVTEPAQPVYQGGNEYTVEYDIVVTNDGEGPGSYTLVEAPDFGTGIDVTAISATSADGTVDPAFALGSLTLADAVDLQADESHTYTVTVTFTIAGDTTLEARDCAGPGTATYNSVSLTYNGVEGEPADDCVDLPDPELTITKVVSDGQPVYVDDNVYTAEYTITVDNIGDGPGAYDLVDTPDFGTGATVTNVTVTGNGVSIDQDGDAAVTIITGESIDPDEAAHVYTVTVTFEVAGSMTTEARTCATGEERAGFGAYNGAEVTYQGGTVGDDDCVDIPEPDVSIIKSLDAANPLTRNADGSWAIGYLLTVSNAADAGPADYDLSDTFDFPNGVTVDDVTVQIVGADPASSVLVAGFDGDGQPVVANDVRIDDGETHVYRVLVDLTIEVVPGIDGSCSTGGGLVNTMSVSVNGDEPLTDDACDSFSTLTLVKQVVNDGGGTATPADFTLTASGPVVISGAGSVASAVPAGTYQLSESQVDGYDLTSLTCNNASGQVSSAVVADGANVSCTFVNDDDPVADLAIVKDASVAVTGPGNAFNWTLVVTNNGPGTALDVEVDDLVPSSLTVGDVTSSFFDCTRSGNAVSCTRPSMAVGASGTITIAVTVNGTAVNGPITNVGTVESSTPDPDLTNNSDDATVEVVIIVPPTTLPPVILPPTGSDSTSPLVRSALALVLLGGVVLLITRRRRGDGTVTPS